MAKVALEIEVNDKGLVEAVRLLSETETALRRLSKGSDDASKMTGRVDASIRELSRGAKLFGTILVSEMNPALAQSLMHFQSLASASRLAGTAITGGLVVAAAAGVTALVSYVARTNEAVEFTTRLNQAARRFDLSGMKSQLQSVGDQLEIETAKAKAFLGGFKLPAIAGIGFEGFAGPDEGEAIGLGQALAEGRLNKLRQQREEIRKKIEALAPKFFELDIIGIGSKIRASQTERAMLTGDARANSAAAIDRIRREEADAKRILQIQTEIALGQATTEDDRLRVTTAGSFKRVAIEEEARKSILAEEKALVRELESIRSFSASLAIEHQQARVKALSAGMEAAKKLQTENQAYLTRIGVPAWMSATVDPRALQLIEEEKRTAIMATEEKLAKNLAAIQQLKTAETERASLVGEANRIAELERARAIDEAVRKSNELYDATRRTREELLTAAMNAQNLAAGMRDAASASAAISPGAGPRAPGGGPAAGLGSAAWWAEGWRQRGYAESFGTAAEQRGFLLPQDIDFGKPVLLPGQAAFQHGGFVGGGAYNRGYRSRPGYGGITPGIPDLGDRYGVPAIAQGVSPGTVPILAHEGEYVLTEEMQRALRDLGIRGQGTIQLTVITQLDGRMIVQAAVPHINAAIAAGQIIIAGKS